MHLVASNIDEIRASLRARNAATSDGMTKSMKTKLIRIATIVTTSAKLNIRKHRMIDSGNLIKSIGYDLVQTDDLSTLIVGSYGVKYAAINEFGGVFSDKMRRAMFARLRATGRKKRPSKGVIQGDRWRARPYLRPAIRDNIVRILEILRS
jgi:phage gpG-like protein